MRPCISYGGYRQLTSEGGLSYGYYFILTFILPSNLMLTGLPIHSSSLFTWGTQLTARPQSSALEKSSGRRGNAIVKLEGR